ncbi:MAG: HAMP domain-containing protein, partial [Vulcanimicrobiaceae bacterium]
MPSLTWRIAAWYAALLILVLAVTSGLIAWRFQQILSDEAHLRIDSTMRDIVSTVTPVSGPLGIDDRSAQSWQLLLNTNNLADWESTTTFVQVDNSQGYPLAKTSNLGGRTIPSNPSLSAGHPRDFRQVSLHGEPFMVEDRYLQFGDSAAILHVAEPLDALNRAFAQTRSATIAIILIAMLAVTVLSYLLASQATRPIEQLSSAMREIGSDRLDRRLAWPHRSDEIGQLAESFDDLLARLEEAFARERQFISDASHELKTPLTSINANAQMLLRWGDRDERTRVE